MSRRCFVPCAPSLFWACAWVAAWSAAAGAACPAKALTAVLSKNQCLKESRRKSRFMNDLRRNWSWLKQSWFCSVVTLIKRWQSRSSLRNVGKNSFNEEKDSSECRIHALNSLTGVELPLMTVMIIFAICSFVIWVVSYWIEWTIILLTYSPKTILAVEALMARVANLLSIVMDISILNCSVCAFDSWP